MTPDEQTDEITREDVSDFTAPEPAKDFPVVGVGASAGGVDALQRFFSETPANTGMAFVAIIHLSPDQKSMMPDILKKKTEMRVIEIEDGMEIEKNTIYINPSDKDVQLNDGVFHLRSIEDRHSERLPIDTFLRSLARDQAHNSVCIILSGSGTDGTQGLKTIKEVLGLVIAQSEDDAEYTGMPRSAVESGFVDYQLPAQDISRKVIDYLKGSEKTLIKTDSEKETVNKSLERLFSHLRDKTGNDFSSYKMSTVNRRIERRMNVNQIEELDNYVKYMHRHPEEIDKLFRELLISVTQFFRDNEAFEELKEQTLYQLVEEFPNNEDIRVWVPGCATGEEAYSIAILLHEIMHELGKTLNIKIFATDLDRDAIQTARKGVYPDSISVDVNEGRLQRYFTQEGDYYRVKNEIREMLIFAQQNLIKDPPFTNIDLLSCRNLLIYLNTEIQKKLIPLLHYSIKEEGYLFLGSSETIGEYTNLFEIMDKKHKIFMSKKVPGKYQQWVEFPLSRAGQRTNEMRGVQKTDADIPAVAQDALLERYAPPAVLVDQEGNIQYFHGRTGKFLEPAAGRARMNVYDMARNGLDTEMTGALNRIFTGEDDEFQIDEIKIQTNGDEIIANVLFKLIRTDSETGTLAMIGFQEVEQVPEKEEDDEKKESGLEPPEKSKRVEDLEKELKSTRENLQTKIEEYQTTNEELKSSNEELQSANEELQSTNEELQTAKEELQSLNEELETVNDELQDKNDELSRAHSDMKNLMNSIDIPVIFLDTELKVKRFTEPSENVINLIEDDIGRPISHISNNLQNENLVDDAEKVLDELSQIEKDLQTNDGQWYQMRINPYRTLDNVIEGVVVTFTDIHDQKVANKKLRDVNKQLRREKKFAQKIIDTVRNPLIVLDDEFRVKSANPSFYETFQVTEEQTTGEVFFNLQDGNWDNAKLKNLLGEVLPEKTGLKDYEIIAEFPGLGERTMLLNANQITTPKGKAKRILLSIEDITEQEE